MKLHQMYEIVMTFSQFCLYNPLYSQYCTKLLLHIYIYLWYCATRHNFFLYYTLLFNFYSVFNIASYTAVYPEVFDRVQKFQNQSILSWARRNYTHWNSKAERQLGETASFKLITQVSCLWEYTLINSIICLSFTKIKYIYQYV